MNRADAAGSGQILGPDPFFDEVMLGAADRRYVTTERIVDTDHLTREGPIQTMCISRLLTDGVVETPGGAHFTACVPDYPRDEPFQRAYALAAGRRRCLVDVRPPLPRGRRSRLPGRRAGGARALPASAGRAGRGNGAP